MPARTALPALFVFVLAAGATAQASDDPAEQIVLRADGIVRAVEDADLTHAADRRHLVETIRELADEDRPAILHALARLEQDRSAEDRCAVLHEALEGLGLPAVTAVLKTLGGPGSTRHDRALVYWYVRGHATEDGLGAVLRAARNAPSEELASQRIRAAIRGALVEVLRRGEVDWNAIAASLRGADPAVQETVLDAVEQAGLHVSLRALSGLLGADERADVSVLRRLARMPVRESVPFAPAVGVRLPGLLAHDDREVRRLAVIVTGRFRAERLIEGLVDRLDDPDAAVAATAQRVLRDRSGARLLPESALWRRWLVGEREWMAKQSARIADRLRSDDAGEVRTALRILASHPLLTSAHLPGVEAAARHVDPAVRREACVTLERLSRASSLPVLAELIGDDDPAVVSAASDALAAATGLRGPATADEWRAELLLGR